MLLELRADPVHQGELVLQHEDAGERQTLMGTLDRLNDEFGRGTLLLASEGMANHDLAPGLRIP